MNGDSIKGKNYRSSDDEANIGNMDEKIQELESLKEEISKKMEEIESKGGKEAIEKMEKIRKDFEKHKERGFEINEENIDKSISMLEKVNSGFGHYKKFLDAFEKPIDIDPGRLLGLTDGIFGMVMTLLIFGMALPEGEISNYLGFLSFASSLAPTIGITLVSFILLGSFWIYHHEFIKIKSLNMPFLWLNILYLACISFIPFTTSIVGNYSHFFLANVIFGANIFLTILLFLCMFNYAYNRNFLEKRISPNEKRYVSHSLYIIMAVTIAVNLLDFNVNHNFIYLFFLVPVISMIRDILFRIKDDE